MATARTTPPPSVLSNRTLIPISLIGTIACGIWWITAVAHSETQNEKDIAEIVEERKEFKKGIDSKLDDQGKILSQVREDVAGIDAKLGILVEYFRQRPPPNSRRGTSQ